MKYDLSKVLTDRSGNAIVENEKEVTAAWVAMNALDFASPDEKLDGVHKAERWVLATKILNSAGKPDLTPEEACLIKELVGKRYHPIIVGQVYQLINNPSQD